MIRPMLCGLILLLLASVWLTAGRTNPLGPRLRVVDLMTKSEYDRTGLAKLSDGEREALDEWLTRYVDGLVAEGRRDHGPEPPGVGGEDRVEICGDSEVPQVGVSRMLIALTFLALGIWFASGLAGNNLGLFESFFPGDEVPGA